MTWSQPKAHRPPASIYVLTGKCWHYDPSDVFTSREAALAEQTYARDVYGEKLTMRHYKLQPKRARK